MRSEEQKKLQESQYGKDADKANKKPERKEDKK